jgi:CheY-like chemotaxis protein
MSAETFGKPVMTRTAGGAIRALLVDDSECLRVQTSRYLAHDERIEVVGLAASGPEALEMVRRLGPDVVLMDLTMPGISGLETTRMLKAQPDPPRVVIVTLHQGPDYRDAAREAGADAFVSKAALGDHLLPIVRGLFLEPGPKRAPSPERHAAATATEDTGTILLVDDDEAVREMVAEILETAGYRVLATGSPAETMALVQGSAPIDAVVTDVIMPGENGLALAARVSAIRPGLKFLFMSGYPREAAIHGRPLPAGVPFLQKPYTIEALLHELRQMLGPY